MPDVTECEPKILSKPLPQIFFVVYLQSDLCRIKKAKAVQRSNSLTGENHEKKIDKLQNFLSLRLLPQQSFE